MYKQPAMSRYNILLRIYNYQAYAHVHMHRCWMQQVTKCCTSALALRKSNVAFCTALCKHNIGQCSRLRNFYWYAKSYNHCGYKWWPQHDDSFVPDSADTKKGLHKNGSNARWCYHSKYPNGRSDEVDITGVGPINGECRNVRSKIHCTVPLLPRMVP